MSTELKKYIVNKQMDFYRLLELTNKAGEIDQLNYQRLLNERCPHTEWDDVYNYFLELYSDLINCLENAELFILEARIVKGAEMIEKETDPKKLKQYNRLYDALIAEHTALKEGRRHEQKTAI